MRYCVGWDSMSCGFEFSLKSPPSFVIKITNGLLVDNCSIGLIACYWQCYDKVCLVLSAPRSDQIVRWVALWNPPWHILRGTLNLSIEDITLVTEISAVDYIWNRLSWSIEAQRVANKRGQLVSMNGLSHSIWECCNIVFSRVEAHSVKIYCLDTWQQHRDMTF